MRAQGLDPCTPWCQHASTMPIPVFFPCFHHRQYLTLTLVTTTLSITPTPSPRQTPAIFLLTRIPYTSYLRHLLFRNHLLFLLPLQISKQQLCEVTLAGQWLALPFCIGGKYSTMESQSGAQNLLLQFPPAQVYLILLCHCHTGGFLWTQDAQNMVPHNRDIRQAHPKSLHLCLPESGQKTTYMVVL